MTGGVRGVGAGISAVFAAQGATVVTCARRPVEGSPYEFHSCDVRDDESVAALIEAIVDAPRPPRRRRQQRGRIALRAGRRIVGEVQHQDRRAQPSWTAVGFDARERGDADAAAGRLDHQRRQRQRPQADAGHRALRRGQGGHGEHHQHAGRRVGAEGPGELGGRRHGGDRAVRAVLRRRRFHRGHLAQRPARPSRQAGRRRLGRGVPGLRCGVLHQRRVARGARRRRAPALPGNHHRDIK